MAARTLRTKHSDEVRAKIQASQLINRLNDHVHGKVTLSSTQVRAAEILLRKSVPDLSRVEMSGPDGGGIPTMVTITHVKPEHRGS
jgi:hypothetical protein